MFSIRIPGVCVYALASYFLWHMFFLGRPPATVLILLPSFDLYVYQPTTIAVYPLSPPATLYHLCIVLLLPLSFSCSSRLYHMLFSFDLPHPRASCCSRCCQVICQSNLCFVPSCNPRTPIYQYEVVCYSITIYIVQQIRS